MFKSHQPRISKAAAAAAAERAMFAPRPFKFPDDGDRDSDTSDTAPVQAQLNPMDVNFCTIPLHAPGRSGPPVQPKLAIGQPGDKYEQEADRMASQVMQMLDSPDGSQPIFQLMRSRLPVQAKGNGTEASQEIESQLSQSKGGGNPLSDEVRSFMEPRFGSSFENVRVHTDGNAVQMNRSLGAQAFTHGSDIYYGAGKSPANSDLTAHELTHVVQQMDKSQTKPIQTQLKVQEKNAYHQKTGDLLKINGNYGDQLIQRQTIDGEGLKSFRFRGQGGEVLQDCFDGKQKLKKGSSGRAVGIVQQALLDLGYELRILGSDGRADEEYGNDTKERVGEFQEDNRLTRDGVVGKNTIRVLDDFFAKEHQEGANSSIAFFLPPPPAEYQPTPTTCWSASLLSWMKAIGEQPKPQPLGRIQVPQDYANFYGFEDDGRTRKVDENGSLFLNDDLSLRDGQFFKVIRKERPQSNPVTETNKTSPDTIRKQLLENGYIYMAFGVGNGIHDVVVYGMDSEKVYYMDPATATYKSEPLPILRDNTTLMVKN